jgi:flagellar assembly protein FliH
LSAGRGKVLPSSAALTPLTERLEQRLTATDPGWLAARRGAAPRPLFAPPAAAPPLVPTVQVPAPAEEAQRREAEARARAEAEHKELAAQRARVEEARTKYLEAAARLAAQLRQNAAPPVELVVDLALHIARELIGRELAGDRELLLAGLDESLRQLALDGPVQLRMGRVDLEQLKRAHPEWVKGVDLIPDETLGPGGCLVESSARALDRSLESRLLAVRELLMTLPLPSETPADPGQPPTADQP